MDLDHRNSMKKAMTCDGVVGKVLDALGVKCTKIEYNESKEEFVVCTENPDNDEVRFVLITSANPPVQTG